MSSARIVVKVWLAVIVLALMGYGAAASVAWWAGAFMACVLGALAFVVAVALRAVKHAQLRRPVQPQWPSAYALSTCYRQVGVDGTGRYIRCGNPIPCPDHRIRYNLISTDERGDIV